MNALRFFIALSVFSNLGLAESKHKLLASSSNASTTMSDSVSISSTQSTARMAIAPSFALLEGTAGWGANAEVLFHTGIPLYVGLVTGFYRWSDSGKSGTTTVDASVSSIPLLASAIYQFETGSSIKPYVGLGAGISISPIKASRTSGNNTRSASSTKVYFNGVLRPGLDLGLSSNVSLYVEPRLGLLDDQFIFLPQAGLSFSL